jgi:hypothetical protein
MAANDGDAPVHEGREEGHAGEEGDEGQEGDAKKANKVAAPRPETKTFVKRWNTKYDGPHYEWTLTSVETNGSWVTEKWAGLLKK